MKPMRLKLGRHVTTTTTMHRLPGAEAYLIDSPGARRFSIWDVKPEELKESSYYLSTSFHVYISLVSSKQKNNI